MTIKTIIVTLLVLALVLLPTSAEEDNATVPDFKGMSDPTILPYIEDTLYDELVTTMDSDQYFVENVKAIYISEEYLEELEFNSQSNIYFGYTLSELDAQFRGERYVFSLGKDGETEVRKWEAYDDTYERVIRNVAIGTGVILICVTVSVVTAGAGAPAVSMIFAVAAKSGTTCALSGAVMGGVSAGIVEGIKTGDMDAALKQAALVGSEGFKWGAISGAVSGGAGEAIALKGATLNGLTMNQAAVIQKESKYPLDVIKQFHSVDEYNVFKTANLKPHIVNGRTALIRSDIELNDFNLKRMKDGFAPLDASGNPFELHHIGQNADGTLAILTQAEHDNPALHGFKMISEINRSEFKTTRMEFWKQMSTLLGGGAI